jgi:carboxyl-terminal processing protease
MSKFWIGAAVTLALLSAPAIAQTPSKYERLAEALWSQVNDNYYDPYFRGTDWAAVRTRYMPRAADIHTDAQFLAFANQMLSEINSSHLYISAPSRVGPAGIGARMESAAGADVFNEVAPLSDAYAQGVRVGDRLLSEPSALRGELGSTASFEVQHCDGRRQRISARRERAFWPPEHPGISWSRITTRQGQSVGYIRATRFDDGAAALEDQAMAELGDTQAMIIDVRNNSGGNISALRLASYFTNGARPSAVLLARPYLQALGHPVTAADIAAAPRVNGVYTTEGVFNAITQHNGGAAFWSDDVTPKYTRPVFVLIDENTGSAAEGFAWHMRVYTQARLIGRTTQGALLSAEGFDLRDGWSVTIPVHGLWGGDGQDYGDRAVPPHQAVALTRADLCAGRDPDLAAAFAAIGR